MVDACKLCGTLSPLVPRSHVIPQWMYALLPQDSRRFRIASSHHDEFEKKSQTGIYGKFVCQACENLFSRWDDHAAIVLRRTPTLTGKGWDYGAFSYGDLIRFYLSVLWRASCCGHPFFETVDLGLRGAVLAKALLSTNDADLAEFEVWPTCSGHLFACGLLTPIQVSIEAVNYWQLYMPIFQALIKVTAQSGAPIVQLEKLRPDTRLLMREKTFTEFDEVKIVEKITRVNMDKKNEKHN